MRYWVPVSSIEVILKSEGSLIEVSQAIRREGMPFEVAKPQPNAETLAALLNEMEILPKCYGSFRELREEIEAEVKAEEACY